MDVINMKYKSVDSSSIGVLHRKKSVIMFCSTKRVISNYFKDISWKKTSARSLFYCKLYMNSEYSFTNTHLASVYHFQYAVIHDHLCIVGKFEISILAFAPLP